tara:strand:+ start:595 stop:1218 length:624 start_codon:yes stop_codon:yes gene_type:complete
MSKDKKHNNGSELLVQDTKEKHRIILDEYFANGFSGGKAISKFRPHLSAKDARVSFSRIKNSEFGKVYIKHRREEIRQELSIKQENVIQNLIDWIQADATDYLDLTPKQLKELPSEVRRSIADIVHKKKTYMENGKKVTEEFVKVKLMDKMKSLDMLSKMMGYYEVHNRQKSKTLDISRATPDQLNAVLSLMTGQIEDNKGKTIDLD